jgi:GNAT superfamily N-acetyltransferase
MFSPDDVPAALAVPLPAARIVQGAHDGLLWVAEHAGAGLSGFVNGFANGFMSGFMSGFVIGFVLCERPAPATLHIREIDVRPDFGRRGIGAALLAHACRMGAARGLVHATLTTFLHLPWNAPFYARQGFRIVDDEAALAPHLVRALAAERAAGLRRRVAMVRTLDARD